MLPGLERRLEGGLVGAADVERRAEGGGGFNAGAGGDLAGETVDSGVEPSKVTMPTLARISSAVPRAISSP